MVKRISCRVVNSVPLKGSGGVSHTRRGDTDRCRGRSVDAAWSAFKSPSNSNGYTFGSSAVRVAFGESAAGRLIDCLA